MPNKPWTKQELELLLSKKKVPSRSKKSIHRKKIQLGIIKPLIKLKFKSKPSWTKEEISLVKQGKSVPGRTQQAIRNMKVRLGLVQVKANTRRPWKNKEENLLKKLVREGKSAKEIFIARVLPKYSRNSIQKKMCSLGLAKKIKKDIWAKDDVVKLKKFLQENYVGKTPIDLVELWNSFSNKKVNKSKVIYHLCNLKIKIPYNEVAKINNLRKKEGIIKRKVFKNAKVLEENIRIERAKIMRERLASGKDIWSGLPDSVVLETA
jgi:hypothetical protein